MSLKMNIDAAVHIDQIMLKELQKVGWVQYRISMYYEGKHFKSKIYLMASNIAFQHKTDPAWIQPSIGSDSHHCYSSKFRMQYINEPIKDNATFYFKGYLDLALIDKIKLFIHVDLLFSESYASKFDIIHTYTATIKKMHNILTYLPVNFDPLGVLRLSGLYHAALMEFKFQTSEDDAQYLENQYKNMYEYLEKLTFGYRLSEITNFYKYYRETLENQLTSLQQREAQLAKIKDKEFHKVKFIKLNPNKKIEALLNQLYHQSLEKATFTQKQQLIQLILQDVLSIKALIYKTWNDINSIIRVYSSDITQDFKNKYQYELKERFRANIFSHRIKNHDWTFSKYSDSFKNHQEHAEIVRKKSEAQNQPWQSTFLIEGENQFESLSKSLKIFQQIYETGNIKSAENVSNEYEHVIVLVHGFQAHRNDFIPLKQCLEVRHRLKVYISSSNIGKTEESIDDCGKRLAIEVTRMAQILNKKHKISFIGHSMGGIIIRSALRFLSKMKQNFHAYISICSPHLGYLYSTSKLVHAGLWLINALHKCDSILQLCMEDNKNLRQCLLYKLAAGGLLNSFKKIAFMASSQDEYVAYESARVEKNAVILTQQLRNRGESEVICEMVDNLLCEVEAFQICRLDVVFCIEENSLDSFLGRTGHVKFLSDPHFIKQFSISLEHLFL